MPTRRRVHDLEANFDEPGNPVATEFVGTSITSAFPPTLWPQTEKAAAWRRLDALPRRAAPGLRIATVTRGAWRRPDFRMVDSSPDQGQVTTPDAAVRTGASFVVERGQAGANRA